MWFGLTSASCVSVTMLQASARPCALPLRIIELVISLEFLSFGCGPSFFISSITAPSLFELASLEVGFNQTFEGDDVGRARLPRLVHDVFG